MLSQTSNQRVSVIATCLTPYARDEISLEEMLICPFDLIHILAIPMYPDGLVHQEVVFGAKPLHSVLEACRICFCTIASSHNCQNQCVLHVA